MTLDKTCLEEVGITVTMRVKAFMDGKKEGMEEAAKICDYREDLQIKTCGDDRAIEAKCCAEDIREAKDKL